MQVNVGVSFFINIFKYKITLTAFPFMVATELIHFSHMKPNLRKRIPPFTERSINLGERRSASRKTQQLSYMLVLLAFQKE